MFCYIFLRLGQSADTNQTILWLWPNYADYGNLNENYGNDDDNKNYDNDDNINDGNDDDQ